MLTDGQPNVSPARGEVETIKNLRYKKNFYTPLYNFGFGYGLQRELLYKMSKFAGGGNGHIPDGGMIATVFCNFIQQFFVLYLWIFNYMLTLIILKLWETLPVDLILKKKCLSMILDQFKLVR